MAFTSDGMFYLSQEDYAPTMDILGSGVRGLFGLQNKEEAVESVLRRTNPDDPASRESALMEIASIDPDAWARVSAIFNEIETSKLGVEEKRLDLKAKRGEATLNSRWLYQVKPKAVAAFAKEYGYTVTGEDDFIKQLNELVNKESITKGERKSILSRLGRYLKEEETNWKSTNKYRVRDSSSTSNILTGLPQDINQDKAPKISAEDIVKPGTGDITETQVDPESSGFMRGLQRLQATGEVDSIVSDMASKVKPALFGSLTLNVEEEKLNERKKEAFDWIIKEGREYFRSNVKAIPEAEKDPLAWYEANIKKKKK